MSSIQLKNYTPTLSSFVYCSEIKNIDFLNINKLINLEDDEQLLDYLNKIINSNHLNSFDKLFCIINIRAFSIGEEIKLIDKNTNVNISIDLKNILDKLLNNTIRPLNDFVLEALHVRFKLPSKLYYNNFIELLLDIVDDLQVSSSFNYKELSIKEKLKILSRLKKEYILKIKKYINDNSEKYSIADIDSYSNTTFNFYDNSVFEYVKFLFRVNISSMYSKYYICSQKMNMQLTEYNSLTPAETDLLLAIYKNSNSIK